MKKLEEMLKEYRIKCDHLNETIKEMESDKLDLEKYNEKANSEIRTLIGMLKKEQEKQKQLSSDLESLTAEIKKYRFDQTGNSMNY